MGDLVRISKAKRTFEKGYVRNWTTELFTVSKRVPGCYPYVYMIKEYAGEEKQSYFCEQELQKVTKTDDVFEVEKTLGYEKRRMG